MDLKKIFLDAEESIKEVLQAQVVKLKLGTIDPCGSLYFVCKVKMSEDNYLKTPRIKLSLKVPMRTMYITNQLAPLNGWELLKTRKYLDQLN